MKSRGSRKLKKGHVGDIVTSYVGGNMEHGLLHAFGAAAADCCGGGGAAAAVSQQGLELSKNLPCLSMDGRVSIDVCVT